MAFVYKITPEASNGGFGGYFARKLAEEIANMIAIHTKYIGPTNSRGSRIKAYTVSGFSATIAYPYALSYEKCHFEAVKALVKKHKLDWDLSNMRYGDSADGKGYSFCFDVSKVEA